jgi:hypothetical protein
LHLQENEVERFYNIWFPLLHYVNQQRSLVPSCPEVWQDAHVSPEVAVPVRNALWEDDVLREAFIAENPANLDADDLALVDSWKERISGDFFIFRHFKKYTVFIDTESPPHGYGVLGITSPLEDVIGPYLPVYAKAVLLPFEDRIIYDSLLSSYSIRFGRGYKRSLNDTYRDIQERGLLLTSLRPGDAPDAVETARTSNKKILSAFQKALGKSGLSPKKIQEHKDTLVHFAGDFLLKRVPPGMLLDISQKDVESYLRSTTGKINLVSFKRFMWFLRDTGRMDWDEAEDLLDYLKQEQQQQ